MIDQTSRLPRGEDEPGLPLHVVRPDGLAALARHAAGRACRLPARPRLHRRGRRACAAAAGRTEGLAGAVFGLGTETAPHIYGGLPRTAAGGQRLAAGGRGGRRRARRPWASASAPIATAPSGPPAGRLRGWCAPAGQQRGAVGRGRGLDGARPDQHAGQRAGARRARRHASRRLAERHGAVVHAGQRRRPRCRLSDDRGGRPRGRRASRWWRPALGRQRGAADDAPLVALCGKGVCFEFGRLRHQTVRRHAADEEGHGRRRRRARHRAHGDGRRSADPSRCAHRLRRECGIRRRHASARRGADPQRTDGRDRQHRCRGPAGAVRPARRGVCGATGAGAGLRNTDRRGACRARAGPAGTFLQR